MDEKGITILRKGKSTEDKRIIESSKKAYQKVEEKTQNIYSLAEQLINSYQTGVEPDDEYLGDIADLAIDYYRKDWHELVDTHHQETKRQRWETEKEGKMKEIR